jgi:flavin-dependent dehydrogenase
MFAAPGWYVGLAPVGHGRVNVARVGPHHEAGAIARNAEAFFFAKLRAIPELAARIRGAAVAREVMVTGPFSRRVTSPVAEGALLVGDAADFYDPFTGEGIFAALRGARLAVETIVPALERGGATRRALAPYAAARRRAFLGKWVLERVVGLGATRPALMRRFTRQLARRTEVADLWVGAAGDSVPVRALFAPRRLMAFVW